MTTREATVHGLAIVGFIALIAGGIYLAVAAAGFVPQTLSNLTSAVYLFDTTSTTTATTTVTTTQTIEEERKPTILATSTSAIPTPTPVVVPQPTPPRTGGPLLVTPQTAIPNQPRLYGLADFSVEIIEIGYLRSSSVSSFREATRVPEGERPAIRFRITNVGTNASPYTWETEIEYPGEDDDTYLVQSVGILMPRGYKDLTFAFDNPDTGRDREFTIQVDPRNRIAEINERNNTDSAEIDIED